MFQLITLIYANILAYILRRTATSWWAMVLPPSEQTNKPACSILVLITISPLSRVKMNSDDNAEGVSRFSVLEIASAARPRDPAGVKRQLIRSLKALSLFIGAHSGGRLGKLQFRWIGAPDKTSVLKIRCSVDETSLKNASVKKR